jgi:hypothetical protein
LPLLAAQLDVAHRSFRHSSTTHQSIAVASQPL